MRKRLRKKMYMAERKVVSDYCASIAQHTLLECYAAWHNWMNIRGEPIWMRAWEDFIERKKQRAWEDFIERKKQRE